MGVLSTEDESKRKDSRKSTESDFINILDDKSGKGTSSIPIKMTLT